MPITTADYPASLTSPKGFEGMRATMEDCTVRTGLNGETSAVIPFGFGVVWPTTPNEANGLVLPSATGFIFAGIAYKTETFERRSFPGQADLNSVTSTTPPLFGYPVKREMGYLTEGNILVWAEQAVNPRLPVYLRHTIGADVNVNLPGRWRVDADAAKADLIPDTKARWLEVTTGPGLAWLTIDLA